jgi:hypothetical protein
MLRTYSGIKAINACYHSVQNILSSRLLSKNIKIIIYKYKTIILPVVLYGCKTGSLTVREEQRLRVFQNRVLRRISGPKRDKVRGGWRKLRKEELQNLYPSSSVIRMIKSRGMRWAEHVTHMGRRGMFVGYLRESQKKTDHQEDQHEKWWIILKWILER